jgi:DNA-nicking Smr family endonuclease
MRPPRRLSPDEAAVWSKVAQTVTPLERRRPLRSDKDEEAGKEAAAVTPAPASARSPVMPASAKLTPPPQGAAARQAALPRSGESKVGLDGSWERRFARGTLEPDFSLDLHGSTLDQAYMRLMHGLGQAKAMQARLVLVVTGKSRPIEAADRGKARGAIRAKIVDWLGASEHAGDIAAIRNAHRRHGGQGALYIVLKRRRA